MRRILIGLAMAAVVGCTGKGPVDGLVIETASVEAGLTGSYTRDGVTIRFAAIRGEENDLAVDPGAPRFAVDARWSDAANRAILLSGSEELLPAAASDAEVDGQARVTELQLALEAGRLLSAVPEAAALAPELEVLARLSEVVAASPLVRAPEGEINYACTIAYSHQLEVHKESLTGNVNLAEHSSVGLWSYKRGTNCLDTLYGYKESCNHGRCASAMSRKCSWASSWRTSAWPYWYTEPSTSPSTVSGGCSTKYGFVSGQHVCNDDSLLQVYGIKNNTSYSRTGGTCGDALPRPYAPGC